MILGLGAYVYFKPGGSSRSAYVMNSEVFAKFKGKQDLEGRLTTIRQKNKQTMDSLNLLMEDSINPHVIESLQQTQNNLRLSEEQLSDKYTIDIWKRINQYMAEFGKEKGYKFIFGATGDGTIMYADDAVNVTEEAIEYMNKKYRVESE